MKLNFILTVIIICICSLIAYAFYIYAPTENKMVFTIGSFSFLLVSGIGLLALSFKQPRTTINVKTISMLTFLIGLILNIIAAIFKFKEPNYIIIFGLLLLFYLLLIYSIAKQKQ